MKLPNNITGPDAGNPSRTTPTSQGPRRRYWLVVLKCYAVLAPALLVALMNTRLQTIAVVHLTSLCCLLTAIVLFSSGSSQVTPQSRTGRWSTVICATLALLWIFVFEILLPSLARAK